VLLTVGLVGAVAAAVLIAVTTARTTQKVTLRGAYYLEGGSTSVSGRSTNCHGTNAHDYVRPGLAVTIADARGHVLATTTLRSTGNDKGLTEWAQRWAAVTKDPAFALVDLFHAADANNEIDSCPMLFTVAVPKRPLYNVTVGPDALDYQLTAVQEARMVVGLIVGSPNSNGAVSPATDSPPPTTTTTGVTSPPSTTPPANPVPAGVVPLVKLLPDDLPVASGCSPASPPVPLSGSVTDLYCTGDPGLPGSTIYAYQFDSQADYVAGLAAYNRAKGFDPTAASPNCPPPDSAVGEQTWDNQLYQTRGDQILECFTQSGTNTPTVPTYIWTIPTQLAFVEAVSGPTTTFSQLDTWWTNNAGPFN